MNRSVTNDISEFDSKDRLSSWIDTVHSCESVEATYRLAGRLAHNLQEGDILCLDGPLGAGKTHFVKGLAAALGIEPETVHSPTFTLIHEYKAGKLPLYHFDFYRIKNCHEALDIGVEDYFYGDGICCIEWPDQITPILPDHALWLQIESVSATTRKIIISARNHSGREVE